MESMDDIQSVIAFLEDEVSWLTEQKMDTDTILGEVYKEIDGDKRVQIMQAAISAMQELEQYRATGLTPHMVEELKDNDKKSHKLAVQRAADLDEYREIGTPEECREAMKRQQAILPQKAFILEGKLAERAARMGMKNYETYRCPECNKIVAERTLMTNVYPDGFEKYEFCRDCGQHIDWGDEYD